MKTPKNLFQIGEIARRAETTIRTVRYYLEEGFFEPAERSPGGFYLFRSDVIDKVRFIQKLKSLGFPLKQIKSLYKTRKESNTGNDAYPLVLGQLREEKDLVEKKISEYLELKKELEEAMVLVSECNGCKKSPTKENCLNCEVLKKRSHIPMPFGAIL